MIDSQLKKEYKLALKNCKFEFGNLNHIKAVELAELLKKDKIKDYIEERMKMVIELTK